MFINELLEAKWQAQRRLMREAEETGMSHFDVVNETAARRFEEAGLTMKIVRPESKPINAPKEES